MRQVYNDGMSLNPMDYKAARRIVVAVIGGTVIMAGAIMLVTPGPGTPTIAVGLGILSLEFYWAKRWLARLRRQMRKVNGSISGAFNGNHTKSKE
jgi:tellurite resistance protein TerC